VVCTGPQRTHRWGVPTARTRHHAPHDPTIKIAESPTVWAVDAFRAWDVAEHAAGRPRLNIFPAHAIESNLKVGESSVASRTVIRVWPGRLPMAALVAHLLCATVLQLTQRLSLDCCLLPFQSPLGCTKHPGGPHVWRLSFVINWSRSANNRRLPFSFI